MATIKTYTKNKKIIVDRYLGPRVIRCEFRKGKIHWYCDVYAHYFHPNQYGQVPGPYCISSFPIIGGKRAVKRAIKNNPDAFHCIATLKKI